jgi:hypothetical protein
MIIQIIKRNHVSPGKNTIINKQVKIPSIGTNGTNGVLKLRGALGMVLRITNTPIQTRINANSVPMLVISPTTLAGTNAANKLTKTMNSKLFFAGVLNFGWTLLNTLGINPSLLIE